jgi:hypothetical protein
MGGAQGLMNKWHKTSRSGTDTKNLPPRLKVPQGTVHASQHRQDIRLTHVLEHMTGVEVVD